MNKSVKIILLITFQIFSQFVLSQSSIINLHNDINIRYEPYLYTQNNFHTSIKPYLQNEINNKDSIDILFIKTSGFFSKKIFNKDIISYSNEKNKLSINPIFTAYGSYDINSKQAFFDTKAGCSINFNHSDKLSINTDFFYGGIQFDDYTSKHVDTTKTIPTYGKYNSKNGDIFLYHLIRGYISYSPVKYINLQAGIGKNFIGDGYRSLFLSDNSNNYPYLKANLNIWKIKYSWLVSQLKDYKVEETGKPLAKKYFVYHYLSWNITKWLNVNAFESIVINAADSVSSKGIDPNYINPVIFYRPVEFSIGSADNVLLGFGFKIKILKKYNIYSQLLLDEFIFSNIKARNGWWGNKFAIQLGIKAFEPLNIKGLYAQLEYNYARPFTYSHQLPILNYASYYSPLAHPLGANFKEIIAILRYHKNRVSVSSKIIYADYGKDIGTVSYGGDIYKSYLLRVKDYNNIVAQGIATRLIYSEIKFSYLLNPKSNFQLEFGISNTQNTSSDISQKNTFISFGLKSHI